MPTAHKTGPRIHLIRIDEYALEHVCDEKHLFIKYSWKTHEKPSLHFTTNWIPKETLCAKPPTHYSPSQFYSTTPPHRCRHTYTLDAVASVNSGIDSPIRDDARSQPQSTIPHRCESKMENSPFQILTMRLFIYMDLRRSIYLWRTESISKEWAVRIEEKKSFRIRMSDMMGQRTENVN